MLVGAGWQVSVSYTNCMSDPNTAAKFRDYIFSPCPLCGGSGGRPALASGLGIGLNNAFGSQNTIIYRDKEKRKKKKHSQDGQQCQLQQDGFGFWCQCPV